MKINRIKTICLLGFSLFATIAGPLNALETRINFSGGAGVRHLTTRAEDPDLGLPDTDRSYEFTGLYLNFDFSMPSLFLKDFGLLADLDMGFITTGREDGFLAETELFYIDRLALDFRVGPLLRHHMWAGVSITEVLGFHYGVIYLKGVPDQYRDFMAQNLGLSLLVKIEYDTKQGLFCGLKLGFDFDFIDLINTLVILDYGIGYNLAFSVGWRFD